MILYSYFRSSASYRVRIALGLKELPFEVSSVNLLAGEQHGKAYTMLNPQGLVPSLMLDEGWILPQSLAIMEYLDERYPAPFLLPEGLLGRVRVRALSHMVASDIAPLGNSGTLGYLTNTLGVSEEQKKAWVQHWITKGLTAVETLLRDAGSGPFCHGDTPGMADCCLIPQVYNARRFGCDLTPFPTIVQVDAACAALSAFAAAHPARQVDAPEGTV